MVPERWVRFRRRLVLGVLALLPVSVLGTPPSAGAAEQIRLFAAASTIAPVNAALALYVKSGGVQIVPVFASSGALARQLAAGAPAHLYLSANRSWMSWAEAQGAVTAESRRLLLRNRLVLAARQGSGLQLKITKSLDLVTVLGDGRLAIADPDHAPLGAQARAALVWMGAWQGLGPRALRLADAAQTRVLVERGEAALGILYLSDVIANPRLEAIGLFPTESHPPITYEIALTPDGNSSLRARTFLDWLSGPAARDIFLQHGFGTP